MKDATSKWHKMKNIWLETAERVVGKAKGKARHKETWWWNEEVNTAVEEKKTAFRNWQKSGDVGDRDRYSVAKRKANSVIFSAKSNKRAEFIEEMKLKEQPSQIFRIAKRMARKKEDISGVNCLRDPGGKLIVDEVGIKEA